MTDTTIIDKLNARIERGKASDRAVAEAAGMTIEEYDADTTAPEYPPQPRKFVDLTEREQTPYYDKAAEILTDLWWCTRIWSAWNFDTMTENDFIKADEDDNILSDTAVLLYNFVQKHQEAQ